jgi:DedD protein
MADSSIREVQVSAKQLVFLFMASVVVLVAVFLLGVSVGRGVRDKVGPGTEADLAAAVPADPSAAPLPPTEVPPGTFKFPDLATKGGGANAAAVAPKADAAAAPVVDQPEVSEDTPATKAAAAPPPAPAPAVVPPSAPAQKPVVKAPELPAQPKPGSGWSVQVNAFRSRGNAEKQTADLKAKGYPAFVSQAGGLFRVRIGSYPDRAEADRVAGKLKQEGLKPSVTR